MRTRAVSVVRLTLAPLTCGCASSNRRTRPEHEVQCIPDTSSSTASSVQPLDAACISARPACCLGPASPLSPPPPDQPECPFPPPSPPHPFLPFPSPATRLRSGWLTAEQLTLTRRPRELPQHRLSQRPGLSADWLNLPAEAGHRSDARSDLKRLCTVHKANPSTLVGVEVSDKRAQIRLNDKGCTVLQSIMTHDGDA